MNNHFFEQKDCGLQAFWSSTPQFKTARVSAHLVLPLTTPENAALYALVANTPITRSSASALRSCTALRCSRASHVWVITRF